MEQGERGGEGMGGVGIGYGGGGGGCVRLQYSDLLD